MPRQSIGTDGRIYYRTVLLPPDQAHRLAYCLRVNATRFTDVRMEVSEHAKGERCCFVTYRPVSSDRVYDQVQREQDKRAARSENEGSGYQFFLDLDARRPFYYCLSVSGEVYEVDHGECSCPDFQYRLKKALWSGLSSASTSWSSCVVAATVA